MGFGLLSRSAPPSDQPAASRVRSGVLRRGEEAHLVFRLAGVSHENKGKSQQRPTSFLLENVSKLLCRLAQAREIRREACTGNFTGPFSLPVTGGEDFSSLALLCRSARKDRVTLGASGENRCLGRKAECPRKIRRR